MQIAMPIFALATPEDTGGSGLALPGTDAAQEAGQAAASFMSVMSLDQGELPVPAAKTPLSGLPKIPALPLRGPAPDLMVKLAVDGGDELPASKTLEGVDQGEGLLISPMKGTEIEQINPNLAFSVPTGETGEGLTGNPPALDAAQAPTPPDEDLGADVLSQVSQGRTQGAVTGEGLAGDAPVPAQPKPQDGATASAQLGEALLRGVSWPSARQTPDLAVAHQADEVIRTRVIGQVESGGIEPPAALALGMAVAAQATEGRSAAPPEPVSGEGQDGRAAGGAGLLTHPVSRQLADDMRDPALPSPAEVRREDVRPQRVSAETSAQVETAPRQRQGASPPPVLSQAMAAGQPAGSVQTDHRVPDPSRDERALQISADLASPGNTRAGADPQVGTNAPLRPLAGRAALVTSSPAGSQAQVSPPAAPEPVREAAPAPTTGANHTQPVTTPVQASVQVSSQAPVQAATQAPVQAQAFQVTAGTGTPRAPRDKTVSTTISDNLPLASAEPRAPTPAQPTHAPLTPGAAPLAMSAGLPVDTGDAAIRETAEADLAPLELKGADLPSARGDPGVSRLDLSRHVAQQVADVARMMPDRPVELTLNPEELGRLRMTFTVDGGSMAVAVTAERPETMDLLRRHIDALAQELREIGYEDVSFDFAQGGHAQGEGDQDTGSALSFGDAEGAGDLALTDAPNAPVRLSLGHGGGMDIRL